MSRDITVTDMFCGAGGSTTGAVLAGADVRLAINHQKRAIETHNSNYPNTVHALTDLHTAHPRRFSRTTGLIASPECTNHSLAKGVKTRKGEQPPIPGMEHEEPVDENAERSRCLMWTPLDWAEKHQYDFIILENVADVGRWKPFLAWLQAWESFEYDYEIVPFNSMFAHPTPQSRDRIYFVAWKKKNPRPDLTITPLAHCGWCEKNVEARQAWKNPLAWSDPRKRCGKYNQQYVYACPHCNKEVIPYYYAAANAIDWSIPIQRIGDRDKPLKPKTLKRIAFGLEFLCTDQAPATSKRSQKRLLMNQSGVVPYLLNLNHADVRPLSITSAPFPTQTTYDSMGIVFPPFLMDHLAEYRPRPITGPISTICASGNHHSVIIPPESNWLLTYYNHGQMVSVKHPIPTVCTIEKHAVVAVPGKREDIEVENCKFRMLDPQELKMGMAFPSNYIVTGNRAEQVEQLGNAVTPPVMKLLMERVIASLNR